MVKRSHERGGRRVVEVNKGAWTAEEDQKLVNYVRAHGDKKWRTLPAKAGLNRCGKSCRLRWLNYLRPGIKRGNISEDEEDLIIRLHNLLGNRWALIAGRIPGRTDNEIKNHWNTHLSKRSLTIDDLNNKLSYGSVKSFNNIISPTSIDPESIPLVSPGNGAEALRTYNNVEFSEFGMEQLFGFMPGSSFCELAVEDYGIAGHDSNQDPFNSEVCSINNMGCLDSQITSQLSEFDDLDQFLSCQDYGLRFFKY